MRGRKWESNEWESEKCPESFRSEKLGDGRPKTEVGRRKQGGRYGLERRLEVCKELIEGRQTAEWRRTDTEGGRPRLEDRRRKGVGRVDAVKPTA